MDWSTTPLSIVMAFKARELEKNISFDANLMKVGENTLKLTIPAAGLSSGVIYDDLRPELM